MYKNDRRESLLDTENLESITGLTVDKVLSADLDGMDGIGGGRKRRHSGEQTSVRLSMGLVLVLVNIDVDSG
jgi:hypothetical protein